MPKKGEYVKFRNYERKLKSPFIICAEFESILMPEDNWKQNPYTSQYQKHIACSYSYKLVCVDDKVSNPFKTYLAKMLFTILLIIWSKKVNTAVKWWKKN